jgi:hypothetical protein
MPGFLGGRCAAGNPPGPTEIIGYKGKVTPAVTVATACTAKRNFDRECKKTFVPSDREIEMLYPDKKEKVKAFFKRYCERRVIMLRQLLQD